MFVSPRDTTDRPPQGHLGGGTPGSGAGALSQDEWQFLRATPDYDAEEMSTVTLASDCTDPPASPDRAARLVNRTPIAAPEFPEASALAELVGDLLDRPTGGAGDGALSGAAWSEVPPAEEWADLMEPKRGRSA